MALNGDRLRRLRAGESRNISHGHPGEVKEILKEFSDDPFGNDEKLLGDGGGRSSATPVHGGTDTISRGLAELPPSIVGSAR